MRVTASRWAAPIISSPSTPISIARRTSIWKRLVDAVLRQMEFVGTELNIIVLDACRNNPLARGARSSTRGLARMDAPTGSFIAYSTAPGAVALDGSDRNSPFATAFAKELQAP